MSFNDIIFLGAGASISEGGPSQADLFRDFFIGFNQNKFNRYATAYEGVGSEEKLDDIYFTLYDFFKIFFGITGHDVIRLQKKIYPTFEEVLGILEIAMKRQECFKQYNFTADNPDLQRIREYLIYVIALVLDESLHHGHGNHRRLLNRLKAEKSLSETCFISLNYDILIDKAIINFYNKYDLDYGIEFTNYKKHGNWRRPRPDRSLSLYKLHGSLNWLYCPACLSMTIYPEAKKAAQLVFKPQNCPNCKNQMIPIIIPPTFYKVMSNIHIQQIWNKTELALRQSKRIFFCGYSFPDADMHIKYILKRAEIHRGASPEIYIINNYPGKKRYEKKIEKERYERYFKNISKVNYTQISFEDFCIKGVD